MLFRSNLVEAQAVRQAFGQRHLLRASIVQRDEHGSGKRHDPRLGSDGPQPAADGRLFRLWAVALLLLCCLGLGRAPLFDVDEGAFSEASREMVASGDWGHTTLNGSDRFDKPILVYWLQAGSAAVLGNSEFALRLPSALCTWAWALALALNARDRREEAVEGPAAAAGIVVGEAAARLHRHGGDAGNVDRQPHHMIGGRECLRGCSVDRHQHPGQRQHRCHLAVADRQAERRLARRP